MWVLLPVPLHMHFVCVSGCAVLVVFSLSMDQSSPLTQPVLTGWHQDIAQANPLSQLQIDKEIYK